MPSSSGPVTLITNAIPHYRVPLLEQLARQLGPLRVLVSSDWIDQAAGSLTAALEVERQNTVRLPGIWRHPVGFREPLSVHFPYDTLWRLARSKPSVLISSEMGLRTLQTLVYRTLRPRTRLILWATVSEHTEQGRGWLRHWLRSLMLRRVDAVIVNGASGARYIARFGVPAWRVVTAPYTTDLDGFAATSLERPPESAHRLLFVGQLIDRKGIAAMLDALERWALRHPPRRLELWMAGDGPLKDAISQRRLPPGVSLRLLGPIAYRDLPALFAQAGIFLFPTLADEWGVVVNEALASGLPVLGSQYSQAVEELVVPGESGWTYFPDRPGEFDAALDSALDTGIETLSRMRSNSRARGLEWTPRRAAAEMARAVAIAQQPKRKRLAILTNVVAPYRRPLFDSFANSFDVSVLTSGPEANRPYWNEPGPVAYSIRNCWGFTLVRTKKSGGGIFQHRFVHINPGYFTELWRARPDAIIATEMGFRSAVALFYGWLRRKPVWIWWGGTAHTERGVGPVRSLLRRFIIAASRRWISYGDSASGYLRAAGVAPDRILQIQNCVDERLFSPAPHRAVPRVPVLLTVGEFVGLKGLDLLLRAAAAVARKDRQFRLVLVGDGPERKRLERLAADLGLAGVEFRAASSPDRMPGIYREADYFVFPTLGDTWGLVVNEALLSGLPVLCSIHAGCAREILSAANLFDPTDPRSFEDGLERLLDGKLDASGAARLRPFSDVATVLEGSIQKAVAS